MGLWRSFKDLFLEMNKVSVLRYSSYIAKLSFLIMYVFLVLQFFVKYYYLFYLCIVFCSVGKGP